MKIEDLKRIAEARTKGDGFSMRNLNDNAFIAMAADNWDKIMHVVDVARRIHFYWFDKDSDDHDQLEAALKALEQE